jgi:hypothetical protein
MVSVGRAPTGARTEKQHRRISTVGRAQPTVLADAFSPGHARPLVHSCSAGARATGRIHRAPREGRPRERT